MSLVSTKCVTDGVLHSTSDVTYFRPMSLTTNDVNRRAIYAAFGVKVASMLGSLSLCHINMIIFTNDGDIKNLCYVHSYFLIN